MMVGVKGLEDLRVGGGFGGETSGRWVGECGEKGRGDSGERRRYTSVFCVLLSFHFDRACARVVRTCHRSSDPHRSGFP